MSRNDALATLRVAAAVSLVCAVVVSSSVVLLKDRQAANAELERKRNVLMAAGLLPQNERVAAAEVERRFAAFEVVAVDLRTGQPDPAFDPTGYDQQKALADPSASRPAPPNDAQLARLPHHALVYERRDDSGRLELLVLPVEGKGLWSTMHGYLALGPDLSTVRGLAFYQHAETPGLGGEVDNPRWRTLWPGRRAFDAADRPVIEVARGPAGAAAVDPHRVDGLSGATITGRGVTDLLRFWLGENGFGPYLHRLRKEVPR